MSYRRRPAVIVMGVSGSGKSTVGKALAAALGSTFIDGDELHPAASIAKMRGGRPLDDADRAPWLRAIASALSDRDARPEGVVVACSALKRAYRDLLRRAGAAGFVFLEADRPSIELRFDRRPHHFMPRTLIASQFEALEAPADTETDILTLAATEPVERLVQGAIGF